MPYLVQSLQAFMAQPSLISGRHAAWPCAGLCSGPAPAAFVCTASPGCTCAGPARAGSPRCTGRCCGGHRTISCGKVEQTQSMWRSCLVAQLQQLAGLQTNKAPCLLPLQGMPGSNARLHVATKGMGAAMLHAAWANQRPRCSAVRQLLHAGCGSAASQPALPATPHRPDGALVAQQAVAPAACLPT